MDIKKNKTLVTVVVLFVAFGLIMVYVPLLFSPSPTHNQAPVSAEEQEDAQLMPSITATTSTSSPPVEEDEQTLPDSFSGLEEESESLDDLLEGF